MNIEGISGSRVYYLGSLSHVRHPIILKPGCFYLVSDWVIDQKVFRRDDRVEEDVLMLLLNFLPILNVCFIWEAHPKWLRLDCPLKSPGVSRFLDEFPA